MKRSNRILLGALLFIFVLIFAGVASSRMIIKTVSVPTEPVQESTQDFEFSGFDTIQLDGNFQGEIWQSETFNIQTSGPESLLQKLQVKQEGQQLIIHLPSPSFNPDRSVHLKIGLPRLLHVDIFGATDLEVNNFQEETMSLSIAGVGNVEGDDNDLEDLILKVDGVSNIDFGRSRVTNAAVEVEGVNRIVLQMEGGTLSGALEGTSHLDYYGEVSGTDVQVSGLSSISRD